MIDYNKKNKIAIKEQRLLRPEVRKVSNVDTFRLAFPRKWAKDLELQRDDRMLLVTLTTDNEIIIRKARPEDY